MSNMIKSTKKIEPKAHTYCPSASVTLTRSAPPSLQSSIRRHSEWPLAAVKKNKKKTQLLVKFPQKDKIHKPIYTYVLSVPAAWRGPHLLRCSVSRQVADWQSSSSTQRVCPLWEATYSTERPTGSQASTYAPDSINTVTHSQWPDSTWQQKESGKVMYLYNS